MHDWFDQNRFLSELQHLIERESPSADLAAVAESARSVSEIGAGHVGAVPEVIVIDGCSHVRWKFGTGPTKVLQLSHHDTVWPVGTIERIPFTVTDGVIRGPGSYDMKIGLLMGLTAAGRLRQLGGEAALDGLSILITGDEEIGSGTSRGLIEDEAAGAAGALVLEAAHAGAALKIARKGVAIYRLEITGRAAHAGSEPEKGINAGIEAAHQILRIAELASPGVGTSVVPSVIEAGTVTNTVPAKAFVSIDSRAITQAEQQRVDDALRSITPVLPGATLTLHGGINRPPMETTHTVGLLRRAQAIAERRGWERISGAKIGGGSDGNFTAGIGTPTLDGLGAVGGGAHAEEEHALLEWVPERTALLTELMRELLV